MSSKLLLEILIIENQQSTNKEIAHILSSKEFSLSFAKNKLEDLKNTKFMIYDAIIMGSSLSVNKALEIGLFIRSQRELLHIPIIFLLQEQSDYDKYQAVKNNVFCIHKSLISSSLENTIKSSIKSHKNNFWSRFLKFKDLVLNTQTQELHRNGKVVPLSAIEFRIMELFLRNPTKIFSRTNIIEIAWQGNSEEPVSTRAVDTHINRLRSLLKFHLNVYDLIKTIRSKGYCISFGGDEYHNQD